MGYEELQGKARAEFWREIVSGQSSCGMSCRNYCESKGVNYERFLYWQSKFRRLEESPEKSLVKAETNFISVANFIDKEEQPVDPLKEEYSKIELELPYGIKLRVSGVPR
jgi:hypothetical protein